MLMIRDGPKPIPKVKMTLTIMNKMKNLINIMMEVFINNKTKILLLVSSIVQAHP
jgi:hypothetical protein